MRKRDNGRAPLWPAETSGREGDDGEGSGHHDVFIPMEVAPGGIGFEAPGELQEHVWRYGLESGELPDPGSDGWISKDRRPRHGEAQSL
jgi:hypothetical protein